MTFSSTKPPRPSSRLFSWLTQWTGHRRDSDQVDVSSSSATSSSNNTTPRTTPPPQPQQHHRTSLEQRRSHDTSTTTEPINVPRTRLSVALSVTDTATDTCYSSSVASSLAEHSQHQNQQQQQQAPAPSTDRLGSSYPDKRVSITSRPASVFSLPPPRLSRDDSATFCCKDDWPRADRMIIRQELVRLVMDGRPFCSPLDLSCNDKRILHVGCGNGGWCIDMANKYKHCWVLGIENWDNINTRKAMPRNFRFWKAHHDIMENLKQLPDNHFDLIYGRFLIFSYPPDYYRDIVKECWRICRPSGYLEMMELDMQIYGIPQVGPMTQMLNSQVIQLMESRSLDPFFARHLQDVFLMHELVEQMQQQHGDAYHAKYISLPLGVWGGRIGVMFRDDLHDLVESIQLSRRLDNDAEVDKEFMAILEKVDEELEANHAFMNLYHAYTQKL